MLLDRLYTVDGISSSRRLSGKQFMCKMELTWIDASLLLLKLLAMIYFGDFFLLPDFLYKFAKTISVIRSSHLFWKLTCCKFWAWSSDNFSSLFLKLSSNFRRSLLRYLRENCFKNWRKFQCQMRGHDQLYLTVSWCQYSFHHILEVVEKGFKKSLFINLVLSFRP